MQGDRIEKLFFMIGLIDRVTEPSQAATKSILTLQKQIKSAAMDIVTGGTSIYSGFAFINKMTGATREFNKAGQAVASLGVIPNELDKLNTAAKKYVKTFGGSATDVVRSAYDIQSAIPGLADGALAAFTVNSATLAKATQSDAATMTGYMGSMYNIFSNEAEKIGQAEWVDQLTGKTAYAVQMFKTDGAKMTQAFQGLGSTAQLMGVSMSEQIAVLGTLQGNMGAAQAGTAYKSFMGKLAQGQDVLGVSFKGDDGQMLPIYEIIEKINGAVGHLDADQKVAQLSKAFGETGAMAVMNMLDKTGQLKNSISDLDKISDNALAVKMAKQQTDQLARFQGVWDVLKISFGASLLPAFNSVLEVMADMLGWFSELVDSSFTARLSLGIFVGAISALVMAFGLLKILQATQTIFNSLGTIISSTTLKMIALKLWTVALTVVKIALAVVVGVTMVAALAAYAAGWLIVKTVLLVAAIATRAVTVAQWLFSAALWASPITWIVLGIVALIAAVVLLIVYWGDICAWLKKSWEWFLLLAGPIGWVVFAFRKWNKISEIAAAVWSSVTAGFLRMWEVLKSVGAAIGTLFAGVWNWIADAFQSVINNIMNVVAAVVNTVLKIWNMITGDDVQVDFNIKKDQPILPGGAAKVRDVEAGGVRNSSISSRTTNYGGITINAANMPRPGELEEWFVLQA